MLLQSQEEADRLWRNVWEQVYRKELICIGLSELRQQGQTGTWDMITVSFSDVATSHTFVCGYCFVSLPKVLCKLGNRQKNSAKYNLQVTISSCRLILSARFWQIRQITAILRTLQRLYNVTIAVQTPELALTKLSRYMPSSFDELRLLWSLEYKHKHLILLKVSFLIAS